MYTNTCKHSFELSVLREYQYNYPLVQQEDLRDLRDVEEARHVEIIKGKKKEKNKEKKKETPNNNNKYYGCIEELLKINIIPITSPNKKHKKTKRNKIFAALCDSSDDDEYSHRTTFSKDINYETKSVNAYDPSSVIEHKEDYNI